ncbi:MAG: class I SAM-dependent methyltransferase [Rhizobiaceae bacterium]
MTCLEDIEERRRFVLENTSPMAPGHVAEIQLHTASMAHDLWLKTEEELEAVGLPPPFWAFAWAGGQGLARYILDNPQTVRGKHVLDLASGSGLVAIAAAKCDSASVTANDIDPFSAVATIENARLNCVEIAFDSHDMLSGPPDLKNSFDIVLAGDVFYDRSMSSLVLDWMQAANSQVETILIGDPGRSYFPQRDMNLLADYHLPVTRELEDNDIKHVSVWQFTG